MQFLRATCGAWSPPACPPCRPAGPGHDFAVLVEPDRDRFQDRRRRAVGGRDPAEAVQLDRREVVLGQRRRGEAAVGDDDDVPERQPQRRRRAGAEQQHDERADPRLYETSSAPKLNPPVPLDRQTTTVGSRRQPRGTASEPGRGRLLGWSLRARRAGARSRWRVIGTGVDGAARPDHAERPRHRILARRPSSCASTSATRRRSRSCCEGPPEAIERQGPALVAALRRSSPGSRPSRPGTAARSKGCGRRRAGADPRRLPRRPENGGQRDRAGTRTASSSRRSTPPVRATQTGFATLSRAIQDESLDAAERGELLALPFLLIVLLLVFRSPVAAAIPLAFGAMTVIASRGILYFFTGWFDDRRLRADRLHDDGPGARGRLRAADGLALPRGAGRRGRARARRRRRTRRTAGRTTMFAGSTLLLSMLVSLFILPGSLLVSLAGDAGDGRRPQRRRGDDRRAGDPHPARAERRPLADRRGRRAGRSRLMALVGAALRRPALAAIADRRGPAAGAGGADDRPEDRPAEPRTALQGRPGARGRGTDRQGDRPGLGRAVPGRRRDRRRADHRPKRTWRRSNASSAGSRNCPGCSVVIGPAQIAKRVEPLRNLGNAVLTTEGNIGPVKELGKLGRELQVAAGGVGAAARRDLAKRATAPACWRWAPTGPGRGRSCSRPASAGRRAAASGRSRRWNGSPRAPGSSRKRS